MTRAEHLQWAKDRAIEHVDTGDLNQAFASFQSDMKKHDETARHVCLPLMTQMFLGGMLETPEKMRKHIEGFN
jgi:hypothetical protein